jgi:hypothetical protein
LATYLLRTTAIVAGQSMKIVATARISTQRRALRSLQWL